jgi:hypothetical protein
VDYQLVQKFDCNDWYEEFEGYSSLDPLYTKIRKAKGYIRGRGEGVTKDKIIAELTMGFWVSLFK